MQRCVMQLVASAAPLGSTRGRFHSSQSAWHDESERPASRCGSMINSTVIRGAWYKPRRRQLDLLFTSGRRYVYSEVPMAIASRFAEAESKGRFYNLEIRNRFPCREVGGAHLERSAA
jgi:hypothetical protein